MFNLTFVDIIDYLGTFAFAISGLRLASEKQFDLFGAFIVGLATAVGGGTNDWCQSLLDDAVDLSFHCYAGRARFSLSA